MKIDLKRLRSDVKRLKADRVASPIGKIKTGATETSPTCMECKGSGNC
jgi:hypothetical protein